MNKKYLLLGGAVIVLIVLGIILVTSLRNKKPETVELNFVTYNEDESNLKEIFSDFEAVNNAKINFVKIDAKDYELESLNLLSTGKIDIWGVPNNWIPKQKDKLSGDTTNLSYYKSIYPEVVQNENIFEGKMYGLPLSVDPLVLFANTGLKSNLKNLTDEANDLLSEVPKNWDDLTTQARLLTIKGGNNITQSGVALGTEDLEKASDILTLLMLQNGTQMTDETKTQATFHTAINTLGGELYPGTAALDFYTSFAKTNNPNYAFSKTMGDDVKAFSDGKIAYMINYASKEKDIQRFNKDLNYSIHDLPQPKNSEKPINYIAYETFTIPNTSKHQDVAWNLLNTLIAKENIKKYYSISKNKPALLEDINNGDNIDKAALPAKNWYNPDPPRVDEIFRSAINQALGGKTPQTALDGAAVQVMALLEKIKE